MVSCCLGGRQDRDLKFGLQFAERVHVLASRRLGGFYPLVSYELVSDALAACGRSLVYWWTASSPVVDGTQPFGG